MSAEQYMLVPEVQGELGWRIYHRRLTLDHFHIGWQGFICSVLVFSPLTISYRASVCFETSSLALYSYLDLVRELCFHQYLRSCCQHKSWLYPTCVPGCSCPPPWLLSSSLDMYMANFTVKLLLENLSRLKALWRGEIWSVWLSFLLGTLIPHSLTSCFAINGLNHVFKN